MMAREGKGERKGRGAKGKGGKGRKGQDRKRKGKREVVKENRKLKGNDRKGVGVGKGVQGKEENREEQ